MSEEAKQKPGKKKTLKQCKAKVDKDALTVFSDNPKMAVTVVSFVTSAGAIIYRLAISAKSEANAANSTTFVEGLTAVVFVLGLLFSLWSIILSYRMIGTITACYLDLVDDSIDNSEAEDNWISIRLNESPFADTIMAGSIALWMVVIFLSSFLI